MKNDVLAVTSPRRSHLLRSTSPTPAREQTVASVILLPPSLSLSLSLCLFLPLGIIGDFLNLLNRPTLDRTVTSPSLFALASPCRFFVSRLFGRISPESDSFHPAVFLQRRDRPRRPLSTLLFIFQTFRLPRIVTASLLAWRSGYSQGRSR